jgi:hypothetical protein
MPTGATITALAVAVAVAPITEGLAMHAAMAAAENHPNLVLVPFFAFVAMFVSRLPTTNCRFDIIKTLFLAAHADGLQ